MKSVHDGKRSLECNICFIKSYRKSQLNRHIESVHEEANILNVKTVMQDFLEMAVCSGMFHNLKSPFKCEICNTDFTSKGHLVRHTSIIHEKKKKMKLYSPW